MCYLNLFIYFIIIMFDVSIVIFMKKIIMLCSDKFICYVVICYWMVWGDLCLINIVIWGGVIDG